jgi:hypothetical protein
MENKTAAYFRARIALIDKLLSGGSDTGEKNNAYVLLRNGLIPGQLLNSKSEETAVNQIMQESNFTETPLSFSEITRWNTWFAMHPEKVAGTEVVTTSFEFPIAIKGTKENIINVLTPDFAMQDMARQKRIRIANAKAKAKLKLLELLKV